MKYFLIVLGIFVSAVSHAQFGIYVQGGGNYSDLRVARIPGEGNGKAGYGWQVGAGAEYHTQDGYFFYMGADFASQTFKKDSIASGFPSVVSSYTYHPLFINLPFGIAYQFDFTKDIGLRVYGGVTTQVGIAGKVDRSTNYYIRDSITQQPVHVRTDNDSHRIHYGRSIQVQSEFQSDLNNTIWGLNIGAGLNFSKAVEVEILYQEGLTNILPGGDAAAEVNKLRSITLNLKFYFPRNYYSSQEKR